MRLFVAIPLLPEIASAAAALLPELPGLRRVRPDLLHVTLAFVGAVADERLDDVVAACREAVTMQTRFNATLDRAGRFPQSGAPRVVWLGLGEGATESANLAAAVRNALTGHEVPFDAKPFRPHLTLARVKDDIDRPTARTIATAVERLQPPPLRVAVEAIALFESVLSPKGPRYTPRALAPLGDAT